MSHGQVAPDPAALVESLRSLGYTLETAVADIVDNSIAAGAKTIEITLDWNDGAPFGRILDDGKGMDLAKLVEAMRLGGLGPQLARSSDDLGRFGLGLKTASFSQCSRLTLATRSGASIACARWDLEEMARTGSGWELQDTPSSGSEYLLDPLERRSGTGTLVLWELLRTGAEGSRSTFLEALERVERHLAMIFHRFIDSDARRLRILLNEREVKAWDPFIAWHPATSVRPIARLRSENGEVVVQGFVLPHRDRFRNSVEHEEAGGADGWVAQQGFYVYRAKRLIVAGGWLGLGGSREWLRDEASQLARIRVDIHNGLDTVWRLDVRKATARPPASLREELVRIAADVRRAARDVYAHRGAPRQTPDASSSGRLWRATASQRFPYVIKREHPAIQSVLDVAGSPELIESMLVAIERSVPSGQACAQVQATDDEINEIVLAARVLVSNLVALGVEFREAVDRVAGTEPFDQVADIARLLQSAEVKRPLESRTS